MHVLGHDDIAANEEPILLANALERLLEDATARRVAELRPPAITTEGDEVQIAGLLEAFESPGHARECNKTPALAKLGRRTRCSG
jgi:hypothetical protein